MFKEDIQWIARGLNLSMMKCLCKIHIYRQSHIKEIHQRPLIKHITVKINEANFCQVSNLSALVQQSDLEGFFIRQNFFLMKMKTDSLD